MIRTSIKFEEKDKSRALKLRKQLESFKEAYVEIGLFEGAGSYEGGQSVVEVALWNEFGTTGMPARPFMGPAIDENISGKIEAWRQEAVGKVIEGEWTVRQALEAIGFRVKGLIVSKIQSNVPPPLAASTRAEKLAHGAPPVTLIDTGLMMRSVTYRVVTKR